MASAFDFYLRTGRALRRSGRTETKFNPWHDPENGRFTFAGQGRFFAGARVQSNQTEGHGFGSRGGSFGGGGAGGSWDEERPQLRRRGSRGDNAGGGDASGSWSSGTHATARAADIETPSSTPLNAREPQRGPSESRLTIRKNGYDFTVDPHARTRRVSGEIRLWTQPRSRGAQSGAGKPDRRITDDGGHYVAARFNGPRDIFDHFAQDANFNRGAYRVLEDKWAKAVRSGNRVFVDIIPHYRGSSMRPFKLDVVWVIDGNRLFRSFANEKQGK